jgi:trehalose synthase
MTTAQPHGAVPIEHVTVPPLALERFADVVTEQQAEQLQDTVTRGHALFDGRVAWNVNSTAHGGGVAEMLHSLIAYARAGGVDARWVVIGGDDDFFRVTKRIHNRLHGFAGDGGPLGQHERSIYEATAAGAAKQLAEVVRPGDVVLLHDPQTAGLVPAMRELGAQVVWRAHIGLDLPNDRARETWAFLLPYVREALACVFSRRQFAWEGLDPARVAVIPPSIDPFSAKNQEIAQADVMAILHAAGLLDGAGGGAPRFMRSDATTGRIDRRAEVVETYVLPSEAPVVAQVSRWDRLKDPLGVMEAFVEHVVPATPAHLVLAGPETAAVTDDPEGADVLRSAMARWESLAPEVRARVHLAMLPMSDAEENAAMVNALQRWSTVVVQKSLAEGFGLTVSEAMWKARPVVAGRVGGIQDQIVDGDSGVLVDPSDLADFGAAVVTLLEDPANAERMGARARERVREEFLGTRHLRQYLELFERLTASSAPG